MHLHSGDSWGVAGALPAWRSVELLLRPLVFFLVGCGLWIGLCV